MTYIKAKYRVKGFLDGKNQVLWVNNGYICITEESIKGLFNFDHMTFEISDNRILLVLHEYDPVYQVHFKPEKYISKDNISTLRPCCTYSFVSTTTSLQLDLKLMQVINNPEKVSELSKKFDEVFK